MFILPVVAYLLFLVIYFSIQVVNQILPSQNRKQTNRETEQSQACQASPVLLHPNLSVEGIGQIHQPRTGGGICMFLRLSVWNQQEDRGFTEICCNTQDTPGDQCHWRT